MFKNRRILSVTLTIVTLFLTTFNCHAQTTRDDYTSKGMSFIEKGQYDEALKRFDMAIQLQPKNYAAYYGRGFIYEVKGKFDQAISDFSKVIELNSTNVLAYASRGTVYDQRGDHDLAIMDIGPEN